MLVHRESAVFAGTTRAPLPASDSLHGESRPFGPIPRSAVGIYGAVLASAGLTLSYVAGNYDGYWATGGAAALSGLWCVRLAVSAGRRAKTAATETEDPGLAAARVVSELEDLHRQLEELTEQCEAFDVESARTSAEAEHAGRVAARIVRQLEDLRCQVDELTEHSAVADVPSVEEASVKPPAAPRPWTANDHRIEPAGALSVRVAVPALVLTALLGRLAWGRTRP